MFKILLQCREARQWRSKFPLKHILLVPKEEVIFSFCDFDLKPSVPSGQKHFILGLSMQQGDSVNSQGTAQCSLARVYTVAIHARLRAAMLCELQEEAAN